MHLFSLFFVMQEHIPIAKMLGFHFPLGLAKDAAHAFQIPLAAISQLAILFSLLGTQARCQDLIVQ